MSGNIFDLEQQIMQCWNVVDDIKLIYTSVCDDPFYSGMQPEHEDKLANLMLGMSELYALKFDQMFKTFEKVCADYHSARKHTDEYNQVEI